MDLTFTISEQEFRATVRAWFESNVPKSRLPSFNGSREGFEAHRGWERKLSEAGYGMVTWPKEFGGLGLGLIEWLIFEEEYYRAGSPGRVNQNGIFLLGPTIMEYGTQEQKARFLPPMAAGNVIWAQAWSEPQAGSDLANVRASAKLDGDHYILKGHKIWSSRAVFADWAFGLFRTDPDSARHRGLSLILFPLNSPGVRVQPIAQIDGELGFAEIFLEDVRIPVANRLGGEGEGWNVCMATAGFERGLMLRSPARYQMAAARLLQLAKSRPERCDATIEAAILQAVLDAESYALSIYATASRLTAGGSIGPEASTNKIFWSELDLALHSAALAILGDEAERLPHPNDPAIDGVWLDGFLFALAGPIYAGANEIQRNIIAERMLGLPR